MSEPRTEFRCVACGKPRREIDLRLDAAGAYRCKDTCWVEREAASPAALDPTPDEIREYRLDATDPDNARLNWQEWCAHRATTTDIEPRYMALRDRLIEHAPAPMVDDLIREVLAEAAYPAALDVAPIENYIEWTESVMLDAGFTVTLNDPRITVLAERIRAGVARLAQQKNRHD